MCLQLEKITFHVLVAISYANAQHFVTNLLSAASHTLQCINLHMSSPIGCLVPDVQFPFEIRHKKLLIEAPANVLICSFAYFSNLIGYVTTMLCT